MQVQFMQAVDYWLGVPMCALLSAWERLAGAFRRSRPAAPPKKLLFIELSEMGSAILAHSAMLEAQSALGRAELHFLIFRKNRESVSLLGTIPEENIFTIEDSSFVRFALSTVSALFKLRSRGIDTAFDLELFSRFTAMLTLLCGATRRAGFYNFVSEGLYRGTFLTHKVLYNPHQHMALNFIALVRAVTAEPKQVPLLKENLAEHLRALPELTIAADESEKMLMRLRKRGLCPDGLRLFAVNPDPGMLALRGWPLENYVELCRKLIQDHDDLHVIIVGAPNSKDFADRLSEQLPAGRSWNMAGETDNLRELLALLSRCSAFLTSDSGPGHMAPLVSVPTVVLFGPETPTLYGPLGARSRSLAARLSCSPCYSAYNHRRSACSDNLCMKALSTAQVENAVLPFLARNC